MPKNTSKDGANPIAAETLCQEMWQSERESPSSSGEIATSGHSNADGRDTRGRFAPGNEVGVQFAPGNSNGRQFEPGNRAALRHGAYSERVQSASLPEQAGVRAVLAEKRLAVIADLGGPGELSAVKADMVDRWVETGAIVDYLARRLVEQGPLTAKGRTRAALMAYLSTLDRHHRLAVALGLERRSKPVADLDAYLTHYAQPAAENER
jgi:hypothetical protein